MNENIHECMACGTTHYCEDHHIFRKRNSRDIIKLCNSCHIKIEVMYIEDWSTNEFKNGILGLLIKANTTERLFLLKLIIICFDALDTIKQLQKI